MTATELIFYLFAGVCLASAFMVIAARNPVYSVLYLILTFFNAAGLFVMMGAEFLALILVVVYVGAVAVLFLFVVMMLDVDFVRLNEGFLQYLPIGATVGLILMLELLLVFGSGALGEATPRPMPTSTISNTEALGRVLYTTYIHFFQSAGAILLVAMVGAIVLTLRKRPNPRAQNITAQNARRARDTVVLKKVKPGQGL